VDLLSRSAATAATPIRASGARPPSTEVLGNRVVGVVCAPATVGLGEPAGGAVGDPPGDPVGEAVGEPVGAAVGEPVGEAVGLGVWVSDAPAGHCSLLEARTRSPGCCRM
jgi:hypothetical protein